MQEGKEQLENALRRLAGKEGPAFWRSLEELAGSRDFVQRLEREFPEAASAWPGGTTRRTFLKLMAASLALAGVNACAREPDEPILPYAQMPEHVVPGRPLFYATALTHEGFARGVLVEKHEGRPTKIEGNPDHPSSLGATDAFVQAAILSLYDPYRSQAVTHLGQISTWELFLRQIDREMPRWRQRGGDGLCLLTGPSTSPTLARQMAALREQLPAARWFVHEPASRESARRGAEMAFGRPVGLVHRFDQADVVLALDCDFMLGEAGSVRYVRDFVSRRRGGPGNTPLREMNRLYVVEPMPTVTGATADHRLPLRASQVGALAAQLGLDPWALQELPSVPPTWIQAVAHDLRQHPGRSLIVVGRGQPVEVHVMAHAMNDALGAAGQTVQYVEPIEVTPAQPGRTLRHLAQAIAAGEVDTLLMIGVNPVYDAPADLEFEKLLLEQVRLRLHHGLYVDETAFLCHWHVPATHELESWGDARAHEGTVTIQQPMIHPLYGGRSVHELLGLFSGDEARSAYEIVRQTWQEQQGEDGFEAWWRKALHDGLVAESAAQPVQVAISAQAMAAAGPRQLRQQAVRAEELEVIFKPDPSVWDGALAGNAWLQELPKPISKLTWDNAVILSPATAAWLKVRNQDLLELKHGDLTLRGPAWIVPGHANECVTLHLGYGRSRGGPVAAGQGFSAYALRSSESPWFFPGVHLRRLGSRYRLACTQDHGALEGRDIIRASSIADFLAHPAAGKPAPGTPAEETGELPQEVSPETPIVSLSLYPDFDYSNNYAWGMVIDLTSCTGCNACTIACQAENNIPVVGKKEVLTGREMHWIRIDRYYHGPPEGPQIYHQPLPCMHCEKAPCEVVCPVAATSHSVEGINEMTYNRCIGTRYCSNNCPYKVRRFNFLQYTDPRNPALGLMMNPDVTVRSRGVMEKCTYCIQRINEARIQAKMEDRRIGDGEVVPACAQACPAQAILFGDLNDKTSRVAQARAQPHNYGLLTELGTQPRTTYLARVDNPNPALPQPHRPAPPAH